MASHHRIAWLFLIVLMIALPVTGEGAGNGGGGKDGYGASFTGVHRYCTRKCTTDTLQFTVTIDRITGAITVTGDWGKSCIRPWITIYGSK